MKNEEQKSVVVEVLSIAIKVCLPLLYDVTEMI